MNKGEKMSSEQKAKISKAHTGMKASAEARKKMSEAKLGKTSWNKGKSCPWAGRNGFKKGFTPWNKEHFLIGDISRAVFTQRLRRKRKSLNGGSHTKHEWEELKMRNNYTCLICRRKEPEIKLTRDHILAISKGGSDDITNIQPLCTRCNQSKFTN